MSAPVSIRKDWKSVETVEVSLLLIVKGRSVSYLKLSACIFAELHYV